MHGTIAVNQALLKEILGEMPTVGVELVVFPPFPYLAQVQNLAMETSLAWGAQNLSEHAQGAFTGEVSASMLSDLGCRYVLVGHSERRALYAETDEIVAQKFVAAQKAGLSPVLCIGETLAERDSGATLTVVRRQLNAVLSLAGIGAFNNAVVAYEPVWAIGTGRTASPEQAQAVHADIRATLAAQNSALAEGVRILYGGSVKADNAESLFAMPDIDGGLVGGASLKSQEFLAICRSACLD